MEKNDGGPAFPLQDHMAGGTIVRCDGMSLRTYFAAAAMNGIISNAGGIHKNGKFLGMGVGPVSEAAVAYADALIVELNKWV